MKRVLIFLAWLGLGCGAASAGTVSVSPDDQSAPVGSTATFTVTNTNAILGALEFVEFTWKVTAGPDIGQGFGVFDTCFLQCGFDFSVQNNGMAGTDVIQAGALALNNGTGGFGTVTITWTEASTVPEPDLLLLIGTGLSAVSVAARRRIAATQLQRVSA